MFQLLASSIRWWTMEAQAGQERRRGARVEMQKKHLSVDLPKRCHSCCCQIERSEWLRCNTCDDINLCVSCAVSPDGRHPCLDKHTFTVMFRIHELSLKELTKHDNKLENVMKRMSRHECDKCFLNPLKLNSWVRCNECDDFDLCMKCWAQSYHEHCRAVGGPHTFTNMSHRYRTKIAPTCAFLSEKNQTLALFEHAGINVQAIPLYSVYDRAYCSSACTKANTTIMHTHWEGNWEGASSKVIGYYCPAGWRRFSVVTDGVDFESSVTVYHGTRPTLIDQIYKNGLRSRECQHGFSAAYVSPSIIYCAHPRYARVVRVKLAGDKVLYAQFVLEFRVNLRRLKTQRKRETLSVGSSETIDPNFPGNESLELLLRKEPHESLVTVEDGVHMTGVMVRVLDHDSMEDAEAWWWTKWISNDELRRRYYRSEPSLRNAAEEFNSDNTN